ncbi:MAG: chemotaxis protein CheB [Alicyclobacillus sp.]|nr:chemotaxis protein CheB [Alicyclobacillus sp.]
MRDLDGDTRAPDVVIIGCSTGGPAALAALVPQFPPDFPVPVLVLQHMPPGFTRPLAARLDRLSAIAVKEGEDGEVLRPGTVSIAPAGLQTLLERSEGGPVMRVWPDAEIPSAYVRDEAPLYRPCIDITLASAVAAGWNVMAVILTGMGKDGLDGCRRVKAAGGRVLAEAADSAVLYGMPRVVAEAGLADAQAPIARMYEAMARLLGVCPR